MNGIHMKVIGNDTKYNPKSLQGKPHARRNY